jgi:hypothetical protein
MKRAPAGHAFGFERCVPACGECDADGIDER